MKEKIIIALDVNNLKEMERLVKLLSPYIRVFKIGMELFYSCGQKAIDIVKKYDRDIFLDLNLCDIPNTVYNASKAITKMGVYIFNVHSLGGREMMQKAVEGSREASEKLGVTQPIILGVTILTSIDEVQLKDVGINNSLDKEVLDLAKLAESSGLSGVVASPLEIEKIRKNTSKDFLIVTPGVRPEGAGEDDQKRVATPAQAIKKGADYIVIGRPVTKAKDPVRVVESL